MTYSRPVTNQSACAIYLSHIITSNIVEPESNVTMLNNIVDGREA